MNRWCCAEVLSLLLIMITAGLLHAADLPEASYRLGEVVVSAPSEGVEASGTIHEVSALEIEERGARTLDEALALVPGLVVRTANDGTPRIDIRGLPASEALQQRKRFQRL